MNLDLIFRRVAFYQVLLGILTFCYAEANPGMLLVAGSMVVLSRYVSEGPWGRPLPRWAVNLLALIALGWMFSRLAMSTTNIIVTMGHFTMWLQVLVMFAHKSNREYGQVLLLSLLQMIGASVLSVSIIYGLLLGVYCVLAVLTVLVFNLKGASDRIYELNRKAASDARRVTRPKQVTGRGFKWQFRLATFCLLLGCAVVGACVFVLIPRTPDYSVTGDSEGMLGPRRVGFSQQVRLDGQPITQGGKEPVMNVRVEYQGESQTFRSWLLRGAVLDRYDPETRTWKRSETIASTDQNMTLPSGGLTLARTRRETPLWYTARITLRQTGHRNLFTIFPATYITSQSLPAIIYSPQDMQMSSGASVMGAVMYEVRWPMAGDRDLTYLHRDGGVTDLLLRPYRDLRRRPRFRPRSYARGWSMQTERIAEFTRQVLDDAQLSRNPDAIFTPDDEAITKAIADYLRENYVYRLDGPRTPSTAEPLIEFMFGHRSGHCELFASALAAMTRSIGMQSRVITGYRAGEYNQIGGYYVVRQSDAHAWVEVNLGPNRGWRSFDATPAAQIDRIDRAGRNWKTVVREAYEHIEYGWIRSVVAYDVSTQLSLLRSLRQEVASVLGSENNWLGQAVMFVKSLPTAWELDKINTAKVLGSAVLALLIGAALLRSVARRRRHLTKLKLADLPPDVRQTLTRQLAFYIEMSDLLTRHGYRRGTSQNPYDYARSLAEQRPDLEQPLVTLTDLFYQVRFGGRTLDASERQRIRVYLRQLQRALTKQEPG